MRSPRLHPNARLDALLERTRAAHPESAPALHGRARVVGAPTPGEPMARACHGCGASYDEHAWGTLGVVERVEPSQVRRLIRGWPDDTRVEIRRCPRCAMEIASKVPFV